MKLSNLLKIALWNTFFLITALSCCLATGLDDSFWVHIECVEPRINNADKLEFFVQWSVFTSYLDDSGFGEWHLLEDKDFRFIAECAEDSEFSGIIHLDTTEGNNIIFDELHLNETYYLRTRLVGTEYLSRSDFASGGYYTEFADIRSEHALIKEKKYYLILAISIVAIISGIGIILIGILKKKSIKP